MPDNNTKPIPNPQGKQYQIGEFKTISLPNIPADKKSTDSGDFIDIMNEASPLLGGVSNLGTFCDITSVTQTCALLSDVEMLYMHIETAYGEQPRCGLVNDGSPDNPADISFEELLH